MSDFGEIARLGTSCKNTGGFVRLTIPWAPQAASCQGASWLAGSCRRHNLVRGWGDGLRPGGAQNFYLLPIWWKEFLHLFGLIMRFRFGLACCILRLRNPWHAKFCLSLQVLLKYRQSGCRHCRRRTFNNGLKRGLALGNSLIVKDVSWRWRTRPPENTVMEGNLCLSC